MDTTNTQIDINYPLSYKQWIKGATGIIPGQETNNYNKYLVEWYNSKKDVKTDLKTQVRLNYILLLKQLQLFFANDEADIWFQQVDFSNEKELLVAIPQFARKLKIIALEYLHLREEIKKTKLKYNLAGSTTSVIQELQEKLLSLFTKNERSKTMLPASIWNNIPELSSVCENIVIEIEELYDDQMYLDRDPSKEASTYYNLSTNEIKNYFSTKNIPLSATDWIYKLGNFDKQLTNEQLNDSLNIANLLIQKYSGENKFTVTSSNTSISSDVAIFDLNFNTGNNIFFWPYGSYKANIQDSPIFQPINLNDHIPNEATAGLTIESADTIFVKTKKGTEGAWLRFQKYDEQQRDMVAYIANNTETSFRFPFPGYGLSADDISWTGPDTSYNADFFYLNRDLKKNIEKTYWSTDFSLSGADPINLNDTTLVKSGAFPNNSYILADKVRVWSSTPQFDAPLYSGNIQEAWLYRMDKTDLPIAANSNNYLIWPYLRVNPDEPLPAGVPRDIYGVCEPTVLSAIELPFCTSSNTLSNADIIFKLPTYTASIDDALECAWLSGNQITLELNPDTKLQKTDQNSLCILCESGQFTTFIWEGEDNTDLDTVFKTYKHQPDCPYTNTLSAAFYDYGLCSCQVVRFTPFGHPGLTLTQYDGLADFIFEDFLNFTQFELTTWKDATGTGYPSSSAFGWYKTSNKIGWGDGSWYTGDKKQNNKFYLQKNKTYTYYRANFSVFNGTTQNLPGLAVRYNYFKPLTTKWIKCVKKKVDNETTQWVSTDTPSDMIIGPGNALLFSKSLGTSLSLLSTYTVATPIAENRGSIWSNYDYVSIIPNEQTNQLPQITVSYPTTQFTGISSLNSQDPYQQYPFAQTTDFVTQLPSLNLATLNRSNILWRMLDPDNNEYFFNNSTSFTFYPTLTGLYTISFGAITASRQGSIDVTKTTIVTGYNQGSIWTPTDLISFDPTQVKNIPTVTISYPSQIYTNIATLNSKDPYRQYPEATLQRIVQTRGPGISAAATWYVYPPAVGLEPNPDPIVIPTSSVSLNFTPTTLGVYRVEVVVISAINPSDPFAVIETEVPIFDSNGNIVEIQTLTAPTTGWYHFTNIPPITATNLTTIFLSTTNLTATTGVYFFTNIPPITATYFSTKFQTISTLETPSPGFVINTPLFGWNYNIGALEKNAAGAKPYWAVGHTEKNILTNYKSVPSWGTPFRIVDGFNILTQPIISDIVLKTDTYVSYERNYPTILLWTQPINYKVEINKKVWSTINFDLTTTSNLADVIYNLKNELITIPTKTHSPIVLQNFVENEPVEIQYHALAPFTWSVTAVPLIIETFAENLSTQLSIEALEPWSNLSNRNYPTVAIMPSLNELYNKKQSGGFFVPNYLGASTYIVKNYDTTITNNVTGLFENKDLRVGGRGLTKTNQTTPYTITNYKNAWLKEPVVSNSIAGTVKKDITKKYQKFIPYQSTFETTPGKTIGLLTPTSKQDPWEGQYDNIWSDSMNTPQTPLGVIQVEKWKETQLLKYNVNKTIYNWCTDIYGNQYGLYKNLSALSPYEVNQAQGELWVRKKSGFVSPAKNALSGVFENYKGSTIYRDLTGSGIVKIETIHDTLYLQTTGALIFEKINYNYETDTIDSIVDSARYLSLQLPVSSQLYREFSNTFALSSTAVVGDMWYVPENKETYITICEYTNNKLLPLLYKLDLNTRFLSKEYPNLDNDTTLINSLSDLNIVNVDSPVITYSALKKEFTYTILGRDNIDLTTLLEINIGFKNNKLTTNSVTVYSPITSLPNYQLPPTLSSTPILNTSVNISGTYQISAENIPTSFTLLPQAPTWTTLSNTGELTYNTPSTLGLYFVPFVVSNNNGDAYYSIIINIQ